MGYGDAEISDRARGIANDLMAQYRLSDRGQGGAEGRLFEDRVMQAVDEALARSEGAEVDQAVSAAVREVMRSVVKAAPTGVAWPMTLDDLLALPLENPAPLPKRSYSERETTHSHVRSAIVQRIGERADGVTNSRITREMWRYAAPEGFPPAPARKRYSHDEGVAIWNWMENAWPARLQLLDLAGQVDNAAILSAQVADVFGSPMSGHSLRMAIRDSTAKAHWRGADPWDATPQGFVKSCAPLFAFMRGEAKRLKILLQHRDLLATQDTPEGMDRQAEVFAKAGGADTFLPLLKSYTTNDLSYGNSVRDEDMPPGYRLPPGGGVLGDDFKIGGKVAPLSVQVAAYRNMQARQRAEGEAQAQVVRGLAKELRADMRAAIEGGATSIAKLKDALLYKGWQAEDRYGVMGISRGQHYVLRLHKPYMDDARKFAGLPAKEGR